MLLNCFYHCIAGVMGPPGPIGPPGPPGTGGSPSTAGTNECLQQNGGCQHYCIDTYDSYYCACREGYIILNPDPPQFQCPGKWYIC